MTHQTLKTQTLLLKGEYALSLFNNQWVSYGPETVITLFDASQNKIQILAEQAKFMDHRENGEQTTIFSVDKNGQPLLITHNNSTLSIKHGVLATAPLEGACLYQPNNGSLEVFLMDERHMAHQYYIKEYSDSIDLILLRSFPLPPGAEYCAVHDTSDQFFVSEENIGVWVYSARAESEIKRSPVDLVKPYGQLNVNSGPLAIIDNELFVAQLASPLVNHYEINDKTYPLIQTTQLDSDIELDSLTAKISNDNHIIFTAVNDATGDIVKWEKSHKQSQNMQKNIVNVQPTAETMPVKTQGDAADDPAIWVHPTQAENSIILATNKKRGLYTYNLAGQEQQELLVDRVNNVDVRQGFMHKGIAADIAAASQRDRNSIALFHINPKTGFVSVANEITTGLDNVYGLCMYKGKQDKIYVFINDEDGRFEQWQILDKHTGWEGKLVREFAVASQPEGCTTDESAQRLFVGEENVALWTLGAEPDDNTSMELISKAGDVLTADIEGMEVYATPTQKWLVVSSQGNDSYVVFNATAPYAVMGEFRITLNDELGIDGASETDGLTVSSANFGSQYTEGLLVVQDGRNLLPEDTQNFKIVSWRNISISLNL
jgi:3-phytase